MAKKRSDQTVKPIIKQSPPANVPSGGSAALVDSRIPPGLTRIGGHIGYSPHSLPSSDMSGQSALESHFHRIGMQNPSLHVKYEAGQGPAMG